MEPLEPLEESMAAVNKVREDKERVVEERRREEEERREKERKERRRKEERERIRQEKRKEVAEIKRLNAFKERREKEMEARQKWLNQDPNIMTEVAQRQAAGQSTYKIGKELGLEAKEVGEYLRKPEVRKLVEQYYLATVSLVPHVYTTLKEELTRKPEGEFDREMRLKASDRVAQISGLLQTRDNSKNVFFQQIIAPTNVQIHPLVQKALMELAGRNEEGKSVIEGEVLPEEEIVWEDREIDK